MIRRGPRGRETENWPKHGRNVILLVLQLIILSTRSGGESEGYTRVKISVSIRILKLTLISYLFHSLSLSSPFHKVHSWFLTLDILSSLSLWSGFLSVMLGREGEFIQSRCYQKWRKVRVTVKSTKCCQLITGKACPLFTRYILIFYIFKPCKDEFNR